MLTPALPAACYTQPHWFQREKEKIFSQLWLLAGLKRQLQKEDSFLTRDFCGTPVLVQNTGGELRAFRNTCAHRGMPLQTAPFGTRKMVCPYHGWAYDANGGLRGLPNAAIYGMCDAERQNISLHRFALETVGDFVFVNLSQSPLPLTQQFSPDLLRLLEAASPFFDAEVSYTHFQAAYNWKLNFENILDWNHAQFVHRNTLAPLIAIEKQGTFHAADNQRSRLFVTGSPLSDIVFSGDADLSGPIKLSDISRIGRAAMPYRPHWYSSLYQDPCDLGAFFACNLFPNANFGSIHGESFYLQQYMPVAPDRIEYHSWVFTTRLKPGVPSQPHLLWGIHHAEKRVIDEDSALLEALQRSLQQAESTGIMGQHEAPLVAMGRWYMAHLAEAAAT